MSPAVCRAHVEGSAIRLETPAYQFELDTADGLRAVSWENRLTGRVLKLGGGLECAVHLDSATGRFWIEGWKVLRTGEPDCRSDDERGYREGFFRPEYDDREWHLCDMPLDNGEEVAERYLWALTYQFIPREAARIPLHLVLGGIGLFDFRFLRAFLNGHEVGVRTVTRRWNEPASFDIGPASAVGRHVRFGHTNVIAVQLRDQVIRTAALDEADPRHNWHFPAASTLASPFEQHLVAGMAFSTPSFIVDGVEVDGDSREQCITSVALRAPDGQLAARIVYRLDAAEPVLRKEVSFTNRGEKPVRLMHVHLGEYRTDAHVTDGECGFPVYLDGERFVSLAHPSGWAMGQDGEVALRLYPGVLLAPGQTYRAAGAVLGVAAPGGARAAFVDHVRSRMRRTARKHDRPYAIFTTFGSWPIADDPTRWDRNSEEIVLDSIAKLVGSQRETGCVFDYYNVDFWVDSRGDLTRCAPDRFPRGFQPIRERIARLGSAPGLWIDSSMAGWTIGDNPAVARTFTCNPSYGPQYWRGAYLCRATDPTKTMYATGFRHHIRENGVRLLKFDNLRSFCWNLAHDHLPGIYSTEAIHDAVISFLRELDEECPDVFLMLYWGYRSPWWLLHADTLFEPGLAMEAASPSATPTLYVRDGVTLGLDQAQWWCRDLPPLGKDSLGVWLSDWWWNSSIGKERWQEGFVMDLCRGSLLAQPWSDHEWLSPPEHREIAEFIGLLRARPECFSNPRFVLGNPWNAEPYGYACAGGNRAFLALNNPTWQDVVVTLRLNSAWGLADGKRWNLYRRYPEPALLTEDGQDALGSDVELALRPFEVVLLEVVPEGETPTLGGTFPRRAIPRQFAEVSRAIEPSSAEAPDGPHLALPLDAEPPKPDAPPVTKRTIHGTLSVPSSRQPAVLALALEVFDGSRLVSRRDAGRYFAASILLDGNPVPHEETVKQKTYPSGWQVWRVELVPSTTARVCEFTITVAAEPTMRLVCTAHFVVRP